VYFILLVTLAAQAFAAAGDDSSWEQGAASLKRQLAAAPSNYQLNHELGELYAKAKRYTDAATYLAKAFEINPTDYDNAFDLALSQLLSGNVSSARKVANDLLARQDRAEVHNLLGSIEEASGDFRKAAAEYEVAARQDPSEKNLFDLGTQLIKYQGFGQAVQVFSYAVNRYPKSAELTVGLGIAQYSVASYKDAVETLCRAVDLNPRDVRALEFLGKMHDVDPELTPEVTLRLKRFAQLYPANPAANYYYALALRNQTSPHAIRDNKTAEELLKKAIAENPAYTDAHYQLALLCEDTGRELDSIQELERVVELEPNLTAAHYRLAGLLTKHNRKAEARREYEIVKQQRAQ
jgi:tetratricopeptide (TPR) repeat protein